MTIKLKLLGTKEAEKLFKSAIKQSRKATELSMEDTVLDAHETAVKRANRVVLTKNPAPSRGHFDPTPGARNNLRPFHRTGNYRRSIKFSIASRKLSGKITAGAKYSKRLETEYNNLKISADEAMGRFSKHMKKNYEKEMRRNRSSGKGGSKRIG